MKIKIKFKKIRIILIVTIVIIALIALPLLIYSNFLLYVQSTVIPDIGKSLGIKKLKGDVVNIGMFNTNIVAISDLQNLSIHSIKLNYSPRGIFNKKINSVECYGTELYAKYNNNGFEIIGVDLSKIAHIANSKYTIEKAFFKNAILNFNVNNNNVRVPLNISVIPKKGNWKKLNFKGSVEFYGTNINFSGDFNIDSEILKLAFSSDFKNINQVLDLLNIKNLQFSGDKGNYTATTIVKTNPLKVISTSIKGDIYFNKLNINDNEIPAKYAKFNISSDENLSIIADVDFQVADTDYIKFKEKPIVSMGLSTGFYGASDINLISKKPMNINCTYRNTDIILKNSAFVFSKNKLQLKGADFLIKSNDIAFSGSNLSFFTNINENSNLKNIKCATLNSIIKQNSKTIQFAKCDINGDISLNNSAIDNFSLNTTIDKGIYFDEKNNVAISDISLKATITGENYKLNKKINIKKLDFKSKKISISNDDYQYNAPLFSLSGDIIFANYAIEDYNLIISSENSIINDLKRNAIAEMTDFIIPLSKKGNLKGHFVSKNLYYKNRNLGNINLKIEGNMGKYNAKGILIHNEKQDLPFAIKATFIPAFNNLSLQFKFVDYIPKESIHLNNIFKDLNGMINGKFSLLGLCVFTGSDIIKNTLHIVGEDVICENKEHKFKVINANGSIFFPDFLKGNSDINQIVSADSISLDNFSIKSCKLSLQMQNFNTISINTLNGIFCEGTINAEPIKINLIESNLKEQMIFNCRDVQLYSFFKQFSDITVKSPGKINGSFTFINKKLKKGNFNTEIGVKNNIKFLNTNSMFLGIKKGSQEYTKIDFSNHILKDFNYEWMKLNLNIQNNNLIISSLLDGKSTKPVPFSISNEGIIPTKDEKLMFHREIELNILLKTKQ